MIVITAIPSPIKPKQAIALLSVLADIYATEMKKNPLPKFMVPNAPFPGRIHPEFPKKIVYQHEPNSGSGFEQWDDPWTVIERGWADCDDAILYRLAELRAMGERAGVSLIKKGGRMHAQVKRSAGRYEDPSLALLERNKKEG